MTRIERIAIKLYEKVPLGRHTHGEMVPWDRLSEELKDRWIMYARFAIGIMVHEEAADEIDEEDKCIECGAVFRPEKDYDLQGDPPRYVPCYEARCDKCVAEAETTQEEADRETDCTP